MPNGTRILVNQRTAQREMRRIADREEALFVARRKQEQAVVERQLRRQKMDALKRVYASADRAVVRLNASDGESWKRSGTLHTVCKRSGPHSSAFCFLHNKEVALVSIPDAFPFLFLGADGHVYRTGRTKTYRAELIKRDWPSEILALVERIDRI